MVSTVLVLGATGSTGKLVVSQLLDHGQKVNVIVRSKERMTQSIRENSNVSIIESTFLDMSHEEVTSQIQECDTIISCLGHTMTFKGIYGKPRMFVRDTILRVHEVVQHVKPSNKMKLIIMGSNGVSHPHGSDDRRPLSERIILSILRKLVPPHLDNEWTAEYLYSNIGEHDPYLQWVYVRPDDLIDADISGYDLFSKPQAGLFGGGQASRSNVAHFMVDLTMQDETWKTWESKMPVIMNKPSESSDK